VTDERTVTEDKKLAQGHMTKLLNSHLEFGSINYMPSVVGERKTGCAPLEVRRVEHLGDCS
jgi:hypothetical protein